MTTSNGNLFDLTGKVALITGGNGGLGLGDGAGTGRRRGGHCHCRAQRGEERGRRRRHRGDRTPGFRHSHRRHQRFGHRRHGVAGGGTFRTR